MLTFPIFPPSAPYFTLLHPVLNLRRLSTRSESTGSVALDWVQLLMRSQQETEGGRAGYSFPLQAPSSIAFSFDSSKCSLPGP